MLIAFDNDAAGNEAAVKLAARLAKLGVETFRVVFPADMDANGYLCQMAEPAMAFRLLIESAVPMGGPVRAVEVAELATHQHETSEPDPVPSVAAAPAEPGVVVETLPNGELEIGLSGQQWRIRGLAQVKAGSAVMKINARHGQRRDVRGQRGHDERPEPGGLCTDGRCRTGGGRGRPQT